MLPPDDLHFFSAKNCPQGWGKARRRIGSHLVPTVGADQSMSALGHHWRRRDAATAMRFPATINRIDWSVYAGIAGEAEIFTGWPAAAQSSNGNRDRRRHRCRASSCSSVTKQPEADHQLRPLAARYALVFSKYQECPSGLCPSWCQPRPASSSDCPSALFTAGQKFGGAPLKSGESRTHHHNLSGSITHVALSLAPLSLVTAFALANGGAASGYAKTTNSRSTRPAPGSSIGFPFCSCVTAKTVSRLDRRRFRGGCRQRCPDATSGQWIARLVRRGPCAPQHSDGFNAGQDLVHSFRIKAHRPHRARAP